jgi:RNA polymerase sigma factor (sigma-70 family)
MYRVEGEHYPLRENTMATRISEVVQHLRQTLLQQDGAGLTDGQLLGRFIEERDEAAAAALVRRHGPMVWGVCRRVLGNHHDAEDAFQATFLVLVRRASAIVPREMVGNWLYGVAHQTALKTKATLAKRRTREKQVVAMPEIEMEPHHLQRDLRAVLDHELSRLPDKYRAAIVLCDLEGKTRTEASRQLGVPPGTLAARLTRGRALLAKRLTRHGLAVSGGTLAAALAEQAALAGQPAALVSSTIKVVTLVATGQAASMGTVSAQVAALSEGMAKAMFLSKIKIAVGIMMVLTVSVAGGLLYKTQASGPADESQRAEQKKAEGARAAAIRALEQLGKSEQASDREAAIQALVDYRRELKAAEEARQRRLSSAVQALVNRFKFRVPVEIGATEFHEGGHIEILEVWGTRPRIEVGGQYLVRGKYKLPPGQRGKIYFYRTATDTRGAAHIWGAGTVEAKAALEVAEAVVDQHKADAARWETEVNRLEREVKRGVVDPQVLLESQNRLKMSSAALNEAEAAVKQKKANLALVEARAWTSSGTPTLDLQMTDVDKPEGEFTLVHGMLGSGYFHLVLADPERYSRMFANVYFGTGDNVLRKKSW